jgi:hypothetical protein
VGGGPRRLECGLFRDHRGTFAGTAVLLVIGTVVTVASAVVLAYIGVQVHRGIQRLSAR